MSKHIRDPWLELDTLCAQKLTLAQMQRDPTFTCSLETRSATEVMLLRLEARIDELRSRMSASEAK